MKITNLVQIFLLASSKFLVNGQQSQQQPTNGNFNTNPYWHQIFLDTRGQYQLDWLVDWEQERVTFNVTVATRGYIGFGLARNGKMEGADIIIGGVYPNGTTYFSDRHAIDQQQPILDQQQDYTLHSAWENDTHTFISFSRSFDTCDLNDIPIDDNVLYLIWAYGERDNETDYHFQYRGSQLAYLRDPDLTPKTIHQANQRAMNTTRYISGQVSGTEIWQIREEFTIPQKRTTYWCSVKKFRPLVPGKKHMVGMNVWINPEAKPNMHHMILYRCSPPLGVVTSTIYELFMGHPGQECYDLGEPLGPIPTQFCTKLIIGHAIGGQPIFFPEHVGIPLGDTNREEYFVLQVDYDNPDFARGVKQSVIQMDIYFTENLKENDAAVLSLGHHIPGSPSLLLPPGEMEHRVFGHCSASCTRKILPVEGIKLFGGILHSHEAGRRMRIQQFRNGREMRWILNDDNFKFQYQPNRLLREEVTVLPGDQVTVQCYYDSTTSNKTIVGGYGTDQEMCKTFLLYYNPIDDYPICRSEIADGEYMRRYLAGTVNVTWSWPRLEFVATFPPQVSGMTLSEISDDRRLVTWDTDLRTELSRDHFVGRQVDVCPSLKEGMVGGLLGVDLQQPKYVSYPVHAIEYREGQRCSTDG